MLEQAVRESSSGTAYVKAHETVNVPPWKCGERPFKLLSTPRNEARRRLHLHYRIIGKLPRRLALDLPCNAYLALHDECLRDSTRHSEAAHNEQLVESRLHLFGLIHSQLRNMVLG